VGGHPLSAGGDSLRLSGIMPAGGCLLGFVINAVQQAGSRRSWLKSKNNPVVSFAVETFIPYLCDRYKPNPI
jgi:hypothetical protein